MLSCDLVGLPYFDHETASSVIVLQLLKSDNILNLNLHFNLFGRPIRYSYNFLYGISRRKNGREMKRDSI